MDGSRGGVVHIDISAEGDGDIDGEVVIDLDKTFASALPSLCIDKIIYGLTGFNCRLFCDPVPGAVCSWPLTKGNGAINCDQFGSLQLKAPAKLRLSTFGLKAGMVGSLVLLITKKG